MIFEHFALNVAKPVEMAEWYVNNLEMKIVRALDKSPFTRFLSDKTGRVVLEIYSNNNARIPDRNKAHPLEFHFAFMADDVVKIKEALVRAGAKVEEELHMEDGSHLIMLRDPFGVPVQICKRGIPMMKF
jgi:catechol 2,3-dioxygenase-like lactoylglutathione lyase family enzyme